ncbi:MAG: helix-hairpin-helix domain-containing protein [Sphaerochaeta sp.]|jgi:hypothetical protein|nr:helix-hairpin-helix domain-containing protein [Sphaerochaeta sp.]
MTILIDTAEPDDIVRLLQQTAPVEIMSLNQTLRNDYYFGGEDGRTRQFGRVQAGELLSNIDSMEDELRRYYQNADDNYMIIEGLITDVPVTRKDKSLASVSVKLQHRPSTLFSYRITNTGWLFGEHSFNVSSELLYAWLFRLSEAGVVTFNTHNYVGTAKCISAIYHNCQKPPESHNTLNRYYIPPYRIGEYDKDGKRISIREQNPFIRSLMALSSVYRLDIGEKKATALYAAGYRSVYDLAFATVKELSKVNGFGKTTAEKLLEAIGVEL